MHQLSGYRGRKNVVLVIYDPAGFNGRRVPHPAVFVIDRAGRVAWKFLNTDARIRAENADILEALDRIDR